MIKNLSHVATKLHTTAMQRYWKHLRIPLATVIFWAIFLLQAGTSGAADRQPAVTRCLADGQGYFRARISGSIDAELDWANEGTACTGAIRPSGGARMRFSHAFGKSGQSLAFVFGIPSLKEGQPARNVPVNLTVIREGAGQFFGTAGDDKCTIDELRQEAIAGIPLRNRSYRVFGRGFCMQPAPAVGGKGSILMTRFDFSGRIDFLEEDETDELMPKSGGQ